MNLSRNARCGDLPDFIAGVNQQGHALCEFVNSANMCLQNGRKSIGNNFTFFSTRGRSVVDQFGDFHVYGSDELFIDIGCDTPAQIWVVCE